MIVYRSPGRFFTLSHTLVMSLVGPCVCRAGQDFSEWVARGNLKADRNLAARR